MGTRHTRFLRLKDVKVVDMADSVAVYTSDVEAEQIAERFCARDQRPSAFVVRWICASFAIIAAAILTTFIGPLFIDSLLIGPKEFPLVQFKVLERGSEFHLGLTVPLVAGFLFALAARVFMRWGGCGEGCWRLFGGFCVGLVIGYVGVG